MWAADDEEQLRAGVGQHHDKRADGTMGQGETSWILVWGKMVPQEPSLAVGSNPIQIVSVLSKMPLPFYSFFRRLALELPCLSLLELGRPLAWCGGTSRSISSVEVGGGILAHCWAVLCNRSMPCSDPSVCKITARADATLCLSFLGINSLVTE